MTKIASALPGGDANGPVAIARELIDSPHEVHVVIALVDCKRITTDNDSGEVVPTAQRAVAAGAARPSPTLRDGPQPA